MKYPQVKFVLNEELNINLLNNFIARGSNKGGANFSELVMKTHPGLEGYDKFKPNQRLEKIKAYVHNFYIEHKSELDTAVQDINREWADFAPHFFIESAKVFMDMDWPTGKYIGYLSINLPYPRFLDSKTFCVPHKPTDKAIRVAAHELLHFIFFEYVRTRYFPNLPNAFEREMEEKLKEKFTIPLWELSEIFNIVVLSGAEWGAATSKQSVSAYSHLEKYLPEFEKNWSDCDHKIDELFTRLEITNITN